jgi:hypothetical protein
LRRKALQGRRIITFFQPENQGEKIEGGIHLYLAPKPVLSGVEGFIGGFSLTSSFDIHSPRNPQLATNILPTKSKTANFKSSKVLPSDNL